MDIPVDLMPLHAQIVKADLLAQASLACDMLAAAANDAARLRMQAQQAADTLLAEVREEGGRLTCETALAAQRQVWWQASGLLAQLEADRMALREQADELLQAMLVQLSQQLLLNVAEVTPALSSVRLLVQAWSHQRTAGRASLYMNPIDLLAMTPLLATVPGWQIEPQPGLPRGDCVLTYDGLEMHASFTAHVTALAAAMVPASQQSARVEKAAGPASPTSLPLTSQELSV